ncbi:MAG TPA: tripartite tricarboxylate transporter substrate binding protein [Burkholderiales bacterium]|jgi:tripartite-type tricarboxylate transporter receptor subunit TctC|nr:tripartite tricarboxylate transporter substrate binding protein [Burkholderiales bacterium]
MNTRRSLPGAALALAALALFNPFAAQAQEYPAHPVKFIVSYPPSGPADILARTLAQKLSEGLGQSVVIDNRAGANGNIGAELAAKAPPDGYTIFMMTSSHAANMTLYPKAGYDVMRDFAHITNVASYPLLLVVHPSVPVKTVAELVALAKAKPGVLNFASAGSGGGAHLAGELFKTMAGVDLVHVPYKGTGPALLDVVGGQVNLMFAGVSAAMPHVKAGKLRPLGVSSLARLKSAPEIPTISESGVKGYEIASWLGVSAPAGTPARIVNRLNAEIAKAVQQPDMAERLAVDGAESQVTSPEVFTRYVETEVRKWGKVIRDSGTKAE